MKLTDTKIRNQKPREKQYKISDGKNLFMLITPTGAKYWRYKYIFAGAKRKFSQLASTRKLLWPMLENVELMQKSS